MIYIKKLNILNILIGIIALVALSFGTYFYYKLNKDEEPTPPAEENSGEAEVVTDGL